VKQRTSIQFGFLQAHKGHKWRDLKEHRRAEHPVSLGLASWITAGQMKIEIVCPQ